MSTLVMRCILSALLLATIANKVQLSTVETADARSAIVKGLTLQGLSVATPFEPLRAEPAGWLYFFAAPGCDRVLQVVAMSLNLQEVPLLESVVAPGYVRRFIYMERTWPTADRLAIRIEWLKHRAASVLGGGRSVISKTVLLVAVPPECNVVEQIDWRAVWEPRTTAKAGSPA